MRVGATPDPVAINLTHRYPFPYGVAFRLVRSHGPKRAEARMRVACELGLDPELLEQELAAMIGKHFGWLP